MKQLCGLVGKFGTGVGEEIGNSMAKQQPHWITVEPGSKEECIAKTGGVLNNTYMRCRNGRQPIIIHRKPGLFATETMSLAIDGSRP